MNNRITERVVFALPFVFVALCCIFAFGCAGNSPPAVSPELECRAKLLEPYVSAVASDLIDAARDGGSLSEAFVKSLHELGVSVEQVSALVNAWERCTPDPASTS